MSNENKTLNLTRRIYEKIISDGPITRTQLLEGIGTDILPHLNFLIKVGLISKVIIKDHTWKYVIKKDTEK